MGTVDLNEIISDILVDFYMTFDLTPVDVKYSSDIPEIGGVL